jgi:hypothetical protein
LTCLPSPVQQATYGEAGPHARQLAEAATQGFRILFNVTSIADFKNLTQFGLDACANVKVSLRQGRARVPTALKVGCLTHIRTRLPNVASLPSRARPTQLGVPCKVVSVTPFDDGSLDSYIVLAINLTATTDVSTSVLRDAFFSNSLEDPLDLFFSDLSDAYGDFLFGGEVLDQPFPPPPPLATSPPRPPPSPPSPPASDDASPPVIEWEPFGLDPPSPPGSDGPFPPFPPNPPPDEYTGPPPDVKWEPFGLDPPSPPGSDGPFPPFPPNPPDNEPPYDMPMGEPIDPPSPPAPPPRPPRPPTPPVVSSTLLMTFQLTGANWPLISADKARFGSGMCSDVLVGTAGPRCAPYATRC